MHVYFTFFFYIVIPGFFFRVFSYFFLSILFFLHCYFVSFQLIFFINSKKTAKLSYNTVLTNVRFRRFVFISTKGE